MERQSSEENTSRNMSMNGNQGSNMHFRRSVSFEDINNANPYFTNIFIPVQVPPPSYQQPIAIYPSVVSNSPPAYYSNTPPACFPKRASTPSIDQLTPSEMPAENILENNYGPGPPIITSEEERGPKGSNLFCFHLPNEMTNWDLYLLFRRFGTILSVHIMINKQTGLSRGFGFISFSSPVEATNAIRLMDGFKLGKKRLKVQLKNNGEEQCVGEDEEFQADTPETYYDDSGNNIIRAPSPTSKGNT